MGNKPRVSNEEFAKTSIFFRAACALSGTEPTGRQAGKYRRRVGLAYSQRHRARRLVEEMDLNDAAALFFERQCQES